MIPSETPPGDSEVILFGKYTGETMIAAYAQDRPYSDWVLATAEQDQNASPALKRFAQYIAAKEYLIATGACEPIPAGTCKTAKTEDVQAMDSDPSMQESSVSSFEEVGGSPRKR